MTSNPMTLPLNQLVEMVQAYMDAINDCENDPRNKDAKRRRDQGLIFMAHALREYRDALSSVQGVCKWTKHDDKSGIYYATACGHEVDDNDTSDTFTHCPYCGTAIEAAEEGRK